MHNQSNQKRRITMLEIGMKAPDFTLPDIIFSVQKTKFLQK